MPKQIKVVFSNERLITPSGLNIVGGMLGKSNFVKRCNRIPVDKKRSEHQIKDGDVLLSYIGLLCQGKVDFEAIREMHDDPEFYESALGITRSLPSAETLRQRMDDIGSSLRPQILEANVDMFRTHGVEPTALETGEVPVDIDVTPMDNSQSHKEGVSRTYKGFDGYAPPMAYIGAEGFLVNTELHEGSQHCQKGMPGFLKETLSLSHKMTDRQLLIRMDSGNDAKENLGILLEDGDWFIVKRNLRRGETKDEWLKLVQECCQDVRNPREGKTVYIGSSWKDVEYVTDGGESKTICMRIVYEVIERSIDKHGQFLMETDVEVNTFWTNLGWSDDEIIASYHAHGECEQYHSEIKTDMDVERLPSGKFETNELVLELTIIAFNLLRMIGQESLKHKPDQKKRVKRRRIRTVIGNMILLASHVTTHARETLMALGRSNTWRFAFMQTWLRFAAN